MILNATPRPGEVSLEVISVGYLRGLIMKGTGSQGEKRKFLDSAIERDFQALESAQGASLQRLCEQLNSTRKCGVYLERFVERATSDSELRQFRQEVSQLARKYIISPDIALGLAGLYFFLKKEYSD